MAGLASPPILHIVENITRPEALRDLRAFYAPGGDGGRFRVHLDEDLGSQIRRYASNETTAAAALPAPKAAAGGGKKRGALTAKN